MKLNEVGQVVHKVHSSHSRFNATISYPVSFSCSSNSDWRLSKVFLKLADFNDFPSAPFYEVRSRRELKKVGGRVNTISQTSNPAPPSTLQRHQTFTTLFTSYCCLCRAHYICWSSRRTRSLSFVAIFTRSEAIFVTCAACNILLSRLETYWRPGKCASLSLCVITQPRHSKQNTVLKIAFSNLAPYWWGPNGFLHPSWL